MIKHASKFRNNRPEKFKTEKPIELPEISSPVPIPESRKARPDYSSIAGNLFRTRGMLKINAPYQGNPEVPYWEVLI